MDAKSGKSFLVNGLRSGIDLNFGTDPAVIDEQITPGQKQPKHCPSWLVAAECCLMRWIILQGRQGQPRGL